MVKSINTITLRPFTRELPVTDMNFVNFSTFFALRANFSVNAVLEQTPFSNFTLFKMLK